MQKTGQKVPDGFDGARFSVYLHQLQGMKEGLSL
jgi:hypothetical protein